MNTQLKSIVIMSWLFSSILQLHAQGYIVPNGVITNYSGAFLPGEISVLHDPTNSYYTGFYLRPQGMTQPTVYTNTFLFDKIVDVSVRVFLVSSNAPINLQSILVPSYTELDPQNYVFNSGSPFYVGLYTGNQNFYPPNGIYSDPLFGWARLVNNQGAIQLLDSALVYKADGIFAGTQNIIPEPGVSGFFALSGLLWGLRRWQTSSCVRKPKEVHN